jgi:6-phospho-3-hexuloisomerase
MNHNVAQLGQQALEEIGAVFAKLEPSMMEPLLEEIVKARRIATYGVGREGLMMKAFCMRLFHLGLNAHVVGDMTPPPDWSMWLELREHAHFASPQNPMGPCRKPATP